MIPCNTHGCTDEAITDVIFRVRIGEYLQAKEGHEIGDPVWSPVSRGGYCEVHLADMKEKAHLVQLMSEVPLNRKQRRHGVFLRA